MAKIAVALDQQLTSEVSDGYGTLAIRVVVVVPKAPPADGDAKPVEMVNEFDEESEDQDDEEGTGPLAAYLEKKSYGKWCAVFLINGQRHDAWDNTFISRDLEFKFLPLGVPINKALPRLSDKDARITCSQASGLMSATSSSTA